MDRAAGGDEARSGGRSVATAAHRRRCRRTPVARPCAPRRRRGGGGGKVRGAQRRPAGPHRGRRRGGGLARLERPRAGEPAFRAGCADAVERPAAALFHLRHLGAAEAGDAHACELSRRPSDDHVRARPAARRHASQHLLARLGQARLVERVCAMERRRDRRRADAALRTERPARRSRRPSDHVVLRPADGLAPVHPARSRPVERELARDLLFGRAARSRCDRAGAARLGTDAARLLRPDRDDDDGRQSAGTEAGGRLDGAAAAGLSRRAARRRGTRVRLRRNLFAAVGPDRSD